MSETEEVKSTLESEFHKVKVKFLKPGEQLLLFCPHCFKAMEYIREN